jgi:ABC-2 type transport system permease protein
MSEMRALIFAETRLLLRDPISWILSIFLPTAILLVFGVILAPHRPDPMFGGLRFIDVFAPSLVVIAMAILALQILPVRLTNYRERGILRRFSTTPVHPRRLLVAQLVVYSVTATLGVLLLIVVGHVVFDIRLPANPLGFVAAFGVGMAGLLAIGLLLAAVAPSAGVATAVGVPAFMVVLLLGGVYVPRAILPDLLIRIGAFTPPGVEGLQDAWVGATPQLLPLAVLAALAVIFGAIASRTFRWE